MFKSLEEYTSGLTDSTGIEQIIQDLGRYVKVMYDRSVKSDNSGRMLFAVQRYNTRLDFNNPIVQKCGGIIMEYGTWKILAMPPYPANPRVKLTSIDSSEYVTRIIKDGTTVTLYHYQNEWHIATVNGISVGPLVWLGKKTYRQIFDECIAKYPEFSLDKLKKDHSYTIGLRHPEYHPFRPSTEAWFIQSYDTEQKTVSYSSDIGIPEQTIVDMKMDDILKTAQNADNVFVDGGEPNFGYVLRHKTNPMGRSSNIIIESSMMKWLKLFVYNDKEGRLNAKSNDYVGAQNRLNYVALKAYLDIKHAKFFIHLFPQYQPIFDKIIEFITALATSIKNGKTNQYQKIIDQVIPYIMQNNHINVKSKFKESILREFLRNPAFTDIYYDFLVDKF
jgi:hypothetical protein